MSDQPAPSPDDLTDATDPPSGKPGVNPLVIACGGCLVIVVLLAAFVGLWGYSFVTSMGDRALSKERFQEITGVELSEDYEGRIQVSVLGFQAAAVVPGGDDQTASFAIVASRADPSGETPSEFRVQLRQGFQSGFQYGSKLVIDTRNKVELTVRGQPVTFEDQLGTDDHGQRIRQIVGTIPAPDGTHDVQYIFRGQESKFDPDKVQAFIDTIP